MKNANTNFKSKSHFFCVSVTFCIYNFDKYQTVWLHERPHEIAASNDSIPRNYSWDYLSLFKEKLVWADTSICQSISVVGVFL